MRGNKERIISLRLRSARFVSAKRRTKEKRELSRSSHEKKKGAEGSIANSISLRPSDKDMEAGQFHFRLVLIQ